MARKRYRAWPQGQAVLFPRSPQDWLPDDHPVRFVLDVVEMLDLSAIEEVIQSKDARGECPYDPRVKVALLINACCTGICSSRKIARATYEQVAFRVLSEGQHPYFTNVNAFRRRHLVAFRELFWQLLCQQAGLVKQGHVALDGTKLQGNASKHEAMSFARMKKLEAEIGGLLFRVDEEEDARLGRGRDASDIPAELRRREARLAKLRAVKVALESEARAARRQHERELAGGCGQRARSAQTDRQRRLSATPAERHRAAADGFANHDDDPPFSTADGLPKHRPRTEHDGPPRAMPGGTSRIRKAGSCKAAAPSCRVTTPRRCCTRRTRRSWRRR